MADKKDMDIMRQLIEKKKEKSASQGSVKRGPQDRYGTSKPGKNRKQKRSMTSGRNNKTGGE